jgi:hypothetical protein
LPSSPLAGVLGEIAVAGAGIPAALLVACPSAYVMLLSALPPPLYPTTLVLLAAVLALAARAAEGFATGTSPGRGRMVLLGALAGLAVWTHLMSLATVAVVALVLAPRAWHARGRGELGWALAALLGASAPWWIAAAREPSATAVLGIAHEGAPVLAHAERVARRLHEPVSALLGAWSPLTADEAERTVAAPTALRVVLIAGWLAAAIAGWTSLRGRPIAALLAGSVVLTLAAFPFPVRSEPYTVRFLTPIVIPLSVLAARGRRAPGGARARLAAGGAALRGATLGGRAAVRGVAEGGSGSAGAGLRARARRPAPRAPRPRLRLVPHRLLPHLHQRRDGGGFAPVERAVLGLPDALSRRRPRRIACGLGARPWRRLPAPRPAHVRGEGRGHRRPLRAGGGGAGRGVLRLHAAVLSARDVRGRGRTGRRCGRPSRAWCSRRGPPRSPSLARTPSRA